MKVIYQDLTAAQLAAAEAALGAIPHDYVVRGPIRNANSVHATPTGVQWGQRINPAGTNRGDGTVK